jgi:hypothetical protein
VKIVKLSNDKQFAEEVQDVVGLYLNPPDNAVWCYRRSRRVAVAR